MICRHRLARPERPSRIWRAPAASRVRERRSALSPPAKPDNGVWHLHLPVLRCSQSAISAIGARAVSVEGASIAGARRFAEQTGRRRRSGRVPKFRFVFRAFASVRSCPWRTGVGINFQSLSSWQSRPLEVPGRQLVCSAYSKWHRLCRNKLPVQPEVLSHASDESPGRISLCRSRWGSSQAKVASRMEIKAVQPEMKTQPTPGPGLERCSPLLLNIMF